VKGEEESGPPRNLRRNQLSTRRQDEGLGEKRRSKQSGFVHADWVGCPRKLAFCLPQSAFRDARSHFFSGSWDRVRHCTTLSLTTHCTAGLAAVLQQLPSAERARPSLFLVGSCWLFGFCLSAHGSERVALCIHQVTAPRSSPSRASGVATVSPVGYRRHLLHSCLAIAAWPSRDQKSFFLFSIEPSISNLLQIASIPWQVATLVIGSSSRVEARE
jgi:hypothetical protein